MPSAVMADGFMEEKDVAKDSLSEYTLFSIEGRETIPNQWSKRLRSGFAKKIPINTVYRYRPREYGDRLARILMFNNNEQSSLGDAPLPEGKIQLYQKNKQSSLTYVAGLNLKYTSVGEKVELNSGVNPEIYFSLVNLKNWRDNIWMHYKKGNLHRRVNDGNMLVDHKSTVSGWNDHQLFVQHLRNFTSAAIKVEVRRLIPGDAQIKSALKIKQHDFQTVDIYTSIASGEKARIAI